MSLFVSFEGGEGSGKTTQAEILCRRLQEAGQRVLSVHEPGSTPLGSYLRAWLKRETRSGDAPSPGAELFLFAAARAELVSKVIKPALEKGQTVVADRYADSTVAYQGYGRRLDLQKLKLINTLATQGLAPDVTFLVDCPPKEGLKRITALQARLPLDPHGKESPGRIDQEGTRRFEEESLSFHQRVRDGYLKLAASEPERWHVIDGTRPVDEIAETVWQRLHPLLVTQPTDSESMLFLG